MTFNNIFGFMNGFKPSETKVVMMFQDPIANRVFTSNGYALDRVKCATTKEVIGFANYELRQVDKFATANQITKLSLTDDEERTVKEACDLGGWTKQSITTHMQFIWNVNVFISLEWFYDVRSFAN